MSDDRRSLAKDWGTIVELFVCDLFDIDRVDDDTADWYDARVTAPVPIDGEHVRSALIVPEGAKIEIKSAAYRVQNDTPRRGRFWITERAHRRLLDADGWYALAVHNLDAVEGLLGGSVTPADVDLGAAGAAIAQLVLCPATVVDDRITSWSDTKRRHVGLVARPRWNDLIDPDEVLITDGGLTAASASATDTGRSGPVSWRKCPRCGWGLHWERPAGDACVRCREVTHT